MGTLAWDDLRYFLAFARAGSMQAAAKALGVNQSTVQRRIAELEEHVGRRLVERHVGGYHLTALGEELRPAAQSVEAAVAAFERDLAARDKSLTGTVRVTCGPAVAAHLQRTPLIDAFQARYPGLPCCWSILFSRQSRKVRRPSSARPGGAAQPSWPRYPG